jgi:predicted nuclease of predicted toxin-antitoxin system
MKFLFDAHLPRALCELLARHGHDAIHTLDLPQQNRTKDSFINHLSISQQRVVISKDMDFFFTHLIEGRPWKLPLVRTGNISVRELRQLFERNLSAIESALDKYTLVEVDRATINPVA